MLNLLDLIKEICPHCNKKIIVDDWPESALINIGRIIELWLKHKLEYRILKKYDDIIRFTEVDGIISKQERKLLSKIRKNYNDLQNRNFFKQ